MKPTPHGAFLTFLAALSLAAPAWAAAVRHDIEFETTASGSPASFDYYRYDLPKFDTSLGTLQRVELFWTAAVTLQLRWENSSNPLPDIYGVWVPSDEISVNTGTSAPLYFRPTSGFAIGTRFPGYSGELEGAASASGYAVNDALTEDLSTYWSADRIELVYGEQLWGLAEAGAGANLVTTGLAKHKFSYVYTYAPTIPEPTSWAMTIFGLGSVGGVLRRRKGLAERILLWQRDDQKCI